MKRTIKAVILTSLLLAAMAVTSQAADMEHHHPGDGAAMTPNDMQEMMQQKMEGMPGGMKDDKSCEKSGTPCSKPCMNEAAQPGHHMKGAGMPGKMGSDHSMSGMDHGMRGKNPGMMHQRMEHELFLDRAEALSLTPAQVTKLKTIHSECRNDNIRKAADAKIARLELKDLLDGQDWDLKIAEPLVRKAQTLEGDMLVRHLQAISAARKVLTAEQLQKASVEESEDLEELFK